MEIRILGWEGRGLRGALEDFSIDLAQGGHSHVLIQMPTGTGKTTTMQLLRMALTGQPFTEQSVASLQAESGPRAGEFALRIRVDDDSEFKIVINFDFVAGTAEYTTIRVPGGNRPGHDLPRPYDRLITPDLTRLFIFDGELADELRDQHLTRADEAIEALYRLSVLTTLKHRADEALERKRQGSEHTKAQSEAWIGRLRTEEQKARDELAKLEAKREKAIGDRARCEGEMEEIRAEIDRLAEQNKSRAEELAKATENVSESARRLDTIHAEIASKFVRPQQLHPLVPERLYACYDRIEAAKLPGPSSAEWFDWLAKQERCVCGTVMDETHREAIAEHKALYLGSEQHGLINEIKHALKQSSSATPIGSNEQSDLDEASAEHREARNRLREIKEESAREAGGDIDALRSKYGECELRHGELSREIDGLDAKDALHWHDSIPMCEQELDRRSAALNEAEGTRDLFLKVGAFKSLIDTIREQTITEVRMAIQKRTNSKIVDVVQAERLSVEAIDSALTLTGLARRRDDVSVGQSLGIAYAFLTSLFEHASYRLPFVVDSPAGPIDVRTRQSVALLLPKMFPQLIMFVQSGEREGFVEAFYEREDVRYVTCWREDETIRFEDGKAFFAAFHNDKEPATT